ncbi:uncharacterized protein LOC130742921 [Lotus japonicus]|uniref:uncharacterized protein LOC130742921 n=1 Tax=Lotus japonicus TaxID=34305 RepID=UPI00258DCBFE|nr:uncharacterized protein LOC130742921 [Lotus japonicus]
MKKSTLLAASIAVAAAAISTSSSSQPPLQVQGSIPNLAGNSTPFSLRFRLKPSGSETRITPLREIVKRALVLQRRGHSGPSPAERAAMKEKFKPRYDGLRFIETLVTAHR